MNSWETTFHAFSNTKGRAFKQNTNESESAKPTLELLYRTQDYLD